MTPISENVDLAAHRKRAWSIARAAVKARLRLPPKLTMSEWADKYRVLSRESSAEPGQWRTDRAPYLREIMDTISGREYQDITILKCSQSGGTEVLNNAVGYYIDQEPSPMLMIQPNVKPMAEAWSKDRLAPMLRDCPRLRGKVKDPRARDSGNTVLHKTFPGGYISAIGANSAAGLASRPIRAVLADELDRWGASAGTEGDPLSLAEARATTFRHRRKIVKVTTLGNEGESRGEKEWEISDQRHFYVPCPHCDHMQPLEWRDSSGKPGIKAGRGDYRLVWTKTISEDGEEIHHPKTAGYQCRSCAGIMYESHKAQMLARGEWIKHNPASNRAGFHISGLLSPWVTWVSMAEKWLDKKDDPEQRKTFINTVVGLLYVETGEVPDAEGLAGRREAFTEEVPHWVRAITMSIDVQGDRLECSVRGWGQREESVGIRLERLYGDPSDLSNEVWAQAEALLNRHWLRADGTGVRVLACMVDTGHLTDAVYRWVKPRQRRRVFAYKGVDNAKAPMSRASKANSDGVKVVSVRPSDFKDVLFRRLRRVTPGPGYIHIGMAEHTGEDAEYLKQFGAEKRQVDYKDNRPKVSYIQILPRNEAIDLYVMSLAALRILPRSFREAIDNRSAPAPTEQTEPTPLPEPLRMALTKQRTTAPRRGGWVKKW